MSIISIPSIRSIQKLSSAAVLLFVFALPAAAQERPAEAFGEVIEVRVVNLEAVVTAGGELVRGLGPEDFVLEVDGREVPIEYFAEIDEGRVDEREGVPAVPSLVPGEAVTTNYLVFVDEYFAFKRDRDRALAGLAEQLAELRPGDRMAIVTFDGRRLEMLTGWTGDRTTLARLLHEARGRPSGGIVRDSERRSFASSRDLVKEAFEGAPTVPSGSLIPQTALDEGVQAKAYAELLASQLRRATTAAASTLRGFAKAPGRKVMLLYAGGWPFNPAKLAVEEPLREFYHGVPYGDRIYGGLVDTANRLGYTLYAIDMPPASGSERAREAQHTLGQLARQTGGRAILNTGSETALARVAADVRGYYWLGFTPNWKGKDEVHGVRLRTRDKKYKVRTRKSYADLARSTEVSMMVEGSLLFDNVTGAGGMKAFLGSPKRAGRSKLEIPFRIAIPLHELTFLPTAEGFASAVELRAAVIDEDGEVANIEPIPLDLTMKFDPEDELFASYESTFKIRKRPHDLVFSLYDRASGKILLSRVSFDPNTI